MTISSEGKPHSLIDGADHHVALMEQATNIAQKLRADHENHNLLLDAAEKRAHLKLEELHTAIEADFAAVRSKIDDDFKSSMEKLNAFIGTHQEPPPAG